MNWTQWREIFRARADRSLPVIDTCDEIPAAYRAPLSASLAKFQVGEAGEGRIARQVAHVRLAAIDDDYREALRLFVKEEGRHARILAAILRAQGGELLRSTWSERLFVRGRRLAGFRLKVLVLLAAEVLGIGFYGLVAARLADGPTRRALLEIAGDEASHLDFHVEFFRRALPGRRGAALFTALWLAIAGAACAVVIVDHRATLKALGIGPWAAIQRFAGLIDQVRREVAGAAAPAAERPLAAAA